MELHHALVSSLAGPLLALADDTGLRRLHILPEADVWRTELARLATLAGGDLPRADIILTEDPARFKPLTDQLGEYFVGQRRKFELPLSLHGTVFQVKVWRQLLEIPYGQLRSYSRLASDLGAPKATQAVGQAAAQNPLPMLVPCHRLLGADGSLVGFAGGTELKARLLRLEGHTLAAGERVRPPQLF